MVLSDQEIEALEKSSVKELRRQAALHSVPLTQISLALEKKDLINLIRRAGPVLDQYDVGVKVWSADSIAHDEKRPKPPKQKKVKKKKRKRSTSSSRSSSSGKKKKRSRSPKAIKNRRKKSRSSSLEMIIPTITIGRKEKPVLEIADTSSFAVPSAINAPVARQTPAAAKAKAAAEKKPDPTPAARGMAAAAALGYNVLPASSSSSLKESSVVGLRPSNPAATQLGIQGLSSARVCVNYMSWARCDMGASCPDRHITDPEEEMVIRAKFKLQECNFGASCTRKGCLFRHPGESREEHTSVPSGQGVALRTQGGEISIVWQ